MQTIDEQLGELSQTYGNELMLQACKNLLNKQGAAQKIKIIAEDLICAAEINERTAKINQTLSEATKQDAEMRLRVAEAAHRLPALPKYRMLLPEALDDSAEDLLISANELMVLEDGTKVRRSEIVRRLKTMETEIKLKEAEAFMQTVDNTVTIEGKTVKLNNAEMRDAYRRQYSADLRKERAELEGELAELNVMEAETKQRRQDNYIAAECLQRRAGLQSALLTFFARG